MKKGWEVKKLGELCTIKGRIGYRGYTKEDLVSKGEGAISLSPSNILGKDFILDNCTYISWFKYDESPEIKIFNGDIIFVKTGSSYGKSALVEELPEKATINPQLVVFKNINCINKYLYYAVNSVDFKDQVNKIVAGSAIPTLSQANLADLLISVPSKSEQQRIVSVLDEAFASIAGAKSNAERNLVNARELFESYLKSVFETKSNDWEEKKLGDIGKVSMCKRVYKEQTTTTGDIPFYKIGTFGKEPDVFIPKSLYDEFRNKFSFPKKGDILISAAGTIGRRVKYDGEPAYFQDSNIVWIDNDEMQVLNDYLYQFYGACDWNSTTGATIPRLYNDNLRQIEISFPKSLAEQRAIVGRLEALSAETGRLEEIYQQKVDALEELKKSILQKAFEGEL